MIYDLLDLKQQTHNFLNTTMHKWTADKQSCVTHMCNYEFTHEIRIILIMRFMICQKKKFITLLSKLLLGYACFWFAAFCVISSARFWIRPIIMPLVASIGVHCIYRKPCVWIYMLVWNEKLLRATKLRKLLEIN